MKQILGNTRIELYKLINSYVLTNPEILYKFKSQELEHMINKLDVLNPMNTIKRGYAIVKHNDKVLVDINKLVKNDILDIDVVNGTIKTKVVEVKNGKKGS